VYRLGGEAISDVRLGELLIVRRPGEVRDIGLLRVVSVHTENFTTNSALAKLESKGETFPLKGDLADKLAPTGIPKINRTSASVLKDGLKPALNPLVMPDLPGSPRTVGSQRATGSPSTTGNPITAGSTSATSKSSGNRTQGGLAASIPSLAASVPGDGLLDKAPIPPPSLPQVQAKKTAGATLPPDMPNFLEQNPIYFLKGSSEISPKGLVRLKEWTNAWGKNGLTYFLSVPQNQLLLKSLTADRLNALQRELHRLGIANVELRYSLENSTGQFDVMYVGVEGPAR